MNEIMIMVSIGAGLLLGFLISYFIGKKISDGKIAEAKEKGQLILKDAEKETNALKKEKLIEVKEEWHKRKQDFENETQSRRSKIQNLEKQMKIREEGIDQKLNTIQKKEYSLQHNEETLKRKESEMLKKDAHLDELIEAHKTELEHISGMSRDDAKRQLIESMVNDAKADANRLIQNIKEEAKLNATRESQKIIVQAIQRTASDHSVETTVSVVTLESDEMKGRIIGREGRNIRAFEAATGIDLIIDDTPEAVVISGFDPFRREVAKKALERLMLDGRIHPTRIEEVVNKTKAELDKEILHIGENVLLEIGLHNMHTVLIKHIGKMRYRSSYGQNLLSHSIEVAHIAGIMAAELGLDVIKAKRAALLHDIGKCVDKDTDGPHALIGYELAKKYKESKIVCNAIGAHHEDIEMESPIAVLVQAADSISGARPGARRESLENYVKRLEKLEALAQSFEGVQKTFAIQAGREIRVIVEPERVDDMTADQMAEDISKKIESEMEYPGQIKVTVIRERRSISLAK